MKQFLMITLLVLGFTSEGVCSRGDTVFDSDVPGSIFTHLPAGKVLISFPTRMEDVEKSGDKRKDRRTEEIISFYNSARQFIRGQREFSKEEFAKYMRSIVFVTGDSVFSDTEIENACKHIETWSKDYKMREPYRRNVELLSLTDQMQALLN